MASHYSVIGVRTRDHIDVFLDHAIERGRAVPAGPAQTITYFDESGAGVFAHLHDGTLVCATPTFDTPVRIAVGYEGFIEDPECIFCSGAHVQVLEDGELVFPFYVQLADAVAVAHELPDPDANDLIELAVTFFGEQVDLHADEAAYNDSGDEDEIRFAPQSFIPAGMFGGDPYRAFLTGEVRDVEQRTNSICNDTFWVARVATLGMEVDVLLDVEDHPTVSPGNIVSGEFWGCAWVPAGPAGEPGPMLI